MKKEIKRASLLISRNYSEAYECSECKTVYRFGKPYGKCCCMCGARWENPYRGDLGTIFRPTIEIIPFGKR